MKFFVSISPGKHTDVTGSNLGQYEKQKSAVCFVFGPEYNSVKK